MAEIRNPGPIPGDTTPPAISDTGAVGVNPNAYARADHTHPSKLRRARMQCAADGSLTWTFDPPFDPGVVPRINAIAETGVGVTDVVNVQVEGTPTNTTAQLRVNRTQRSVAAVLGLTVLSVPASVGVQWVHASAAAN